MTTKQWTNPAILLLTLVLAGCGSTPSSNYYVLSKGDLPLPTTREPSLGIGPVEIPEYLNRNGLVYRRDSHQLQIAQFERWAEPLDEGIARIVGLNLAGLLDTQSLRTYPWHSLHAPQYGVKLKVMSLDADLQHASLVVEWLLHKPGGNISGDNTVRRQISQFKTPLNGTPIEPGKLPGIYSDLLFQLSAVIADAIRQDMDS